MNSLALLDISGLQATLVEFANQRGWEQFHSPKNLTMALGGEVGELIAVFQWLTEEQSKSAATNAATAQAVRDELADVMIYLARLSAVLGVDLNAAVAEKIEKNALKYPAPSQPNE
jgi:dCTP diphosphatase